MTRSIGNAAPGWVKRLEKLLNSLLALDAEMPEALSRIQGKTIAFEFVNTRYVLFICPSTDGIRIRTYYDAKPDVLIRGTPGNFLMMLNSSAEGLQTDIQITGDVMLARRFREIIQSVELDWEEPLSDWVGDSAAYQIGRFFRNLGRFAMRTGTTLAVDLSEYLRFETRMLPDDLLVEEFCNEVSNLREDADRFARRVNAFETLVTGEQPE